MELKGFTTAYQLAELLDVNPSTIGNIRTGKLALSLKLLIRIQNVYGMSIREMRDLMDDRRVEIRMAELVDSE
jgi:plasmid maintenance system antidote protein VapI